MRPRAGLTRSSGGSTSAALPKHATYAVSTHHAAKAHHKARPKVHAKAHPKAHHKSHPKARHHVAPQAHHYRVRSGDTLSTIARHFHVHDGWHGLWKLNRASVHNPNVLHIGQVLRLPA